MRVDGQVDGNGNGGFVLGTTVCGCEFLPKAIQGMVGQTIMPLGFEVRGSDPGQNVSVVVEGKGGERHRVPIQHFSQHPPVAELRKASVRV